MPKHRDVGLAIQAMRNFLLGRKHTVALRFEEQVASRTQLPAAIPQGPSHKLSGNYYFNRDCRREMKPPIEVIGPKLLNADKPSNEKLCTPGKTHRM